MTTESRILAYTVELNGVPWRFERLGDEMESRLQVADKKRKQPAWASLIDTNGAASKRRFI